ncbi:hypothetical protein GGF37_000813 [Kickxella alabastrina]|nr:hypothetical protein GGF37_000813 [Kickxella alabastrina]
MIPPTQPTPSYTLRYHENNLHAEVAKVLLKGWYSRWRLDTSELSEQTPRQSTTQIVLVEHTNTIDSHFTLIGASAIEIYLASNRGLCSTSDKRLLARQIQFRNSIKELLNDALPFINLCKGKTPEEDSETTRYQEIFLRSIKNFIKFHENALWQNGSTGYYFESRVTFVEVALAVTINLIRSLIPKPFSAVHDALKNNNLPEINRVISKTWLKISATTIPTICSSDAASDATQKTPKPNVFQFKPSTKFGSSFPTPTFAAPSSTAASGSTSAAAKTFSGFGSLSIAAKTTTPPTAAISASAAAEVVPDAASATIPVPASFAQCTSNVDKSVAVSAATTSAPAAIPATVGAPTTVVPGPSGSSAGDVAQK